MAIYDELIYRRGENRYRFFKSNDELKKHLKSNKNVKCEKHDPGYISKKHTIAFQGVFEKNINQ